MSIEAAPTNLIAGKYKIIRPLGAGSLATVNLAKDLRGRQVAIKTYDRVAQNKQIAPDTVAPLLRQLDTTARTIYLGLDHPNIIKLHEVTDDGSLVMEYANHKTAGERQAKHGGPIPTDIALWYLDGALTGLAGAHEQGVTVNDLKPDNLIVTFDPKTGMYTSKINDLDGLHRKGTSVGIMVGSVAYIAPERLTHPDEPTNKSDVFTAGVTLQMLLTYQYAYTYTGGSIEEMIKSHKQGRITLEKALSARRMTALHDVIEPFLAAALDNNPAKRPEVEELRTELRLAPMRAAIKEREKKTVIDLADETTEAKPRGDLKAPTDVIVRQETKDIDSQNQPAVVLRHSTPASDGSVERVLVPRKSKKRPKGTMRRRVGKVVAAITAASVLSAGFAEAVNIFKKSDVSLSWFKNNDLKLDKKPDSPSKPSDKPSPLVSHTQFTVQPSKSYSPSAIPDVHPTHKVENTQTISPSATTTAPTESASPSEPLPSDSPTPTHSPEATASPTPTPTPTESPVVESPAASPETT